MATGHEAGLKLLELTGGEELLLQEHTAPDDAPSLRLCEVPLPHLLKHSLVVDALEPLLEVLPDLLDAFAPILEVLGEILKIIPIKPFMDLVVSVLMPLLIPALLLVSGILKDLEPILKVIFDLINDVMKVLGPVLEGISKLAGGLIGGLTSGIGSVIGGIGKVFGIGDGIVQNGQVITTDPTDYIIATKTPQDLASSGSGTVNYNFINNGSVMSEYDFGQLVRKFLIQTSSRNTTSLTSLYTSA